MAWCPIIFQFSRFNLYFFLSIWPTFISWNLLEYYPNLRYFNSEILYMNDYIIIWPKWLSWNFSRVNNDNCIYTVKGFVIVLHPRCMHTNMEWLNQICHPCVSFLWAIHTWPVLGIYRTNAPALYLVSFQFWYPWFVHRA